MGIEVTLAATGPVALDLAFSVRPGEVLALVGPSGAGKSTVLRSIAGLWRPHVSRIVVAGKVWQDTATDVHLPTHHRAVGMVFQSYALFPHLDALGNLMLAMGHLPKAARRAEALRLLDMLGLGAQANQRPSDLSGGQQQRVAVARALARDPKVLLMDEPFSAVDRPAREAVYEALLALRSRLAMPVVLVTHDIDEAQRLADRMLVMAAGACVATGGAAEVLTDPAALRVLGLREAGSMLRATVEGDEADGLTRLCTGVGPVFVPQVGAPPGTRLRLRIPAHEVMISLARPQGLSALNVLPVVVQGWVEGDGPGVMLRLAAGDEMVLARITRRSAQSLGLVPGLACFAVLKSMAVAREQLRE